MTTGKVNLSEDTRKGLPFGKVEWHSKPRTMIAKNQASSQLVTPLLRELYGMAVLCRRSTRMPARVDVFFSPFSLHGL